MRPDRSLINPSKSTAEAGNARRDGATNAFAADAAKSGKVGNPAVARGLVPPNREYPTVRPRAAQFRPPCCEMDHGPEKRHGLLRRREQRHRLPVEPGIFTILPPLTAFVHRKIDYNQLLESKFPWHG
jgi:hypothetical protein